MSCASLRNRLIPLCCCGLLFLCTASGVYGQQGSSSLNAGRRQPDTASPLTTPASTTAAAYEVAGVVLDTRNRNPIPRALVHLGNRAVLTEHDGTFHFPEVTAALFTLFANKPGFQSGPDQNQGSSRSFRPPISAPIELFLSPEAVLSGTVSNSNGEPLSGLNVTAQRSAFDEYGHHWFPAGQARTNNEGEFRLLVPAGIYSVQVNQFGRTGTGTEIVLPLAIPAPSSSSLAEAIHLLPGEETHLDLRPEVRPSYRVTVNVEPFSRGFPNLRVRTSSGLTMPVLPMSSPGNQGELRISLPRGTYILSGSMQDQNGLSEAQTQVTITDHDVTGVILRFTRAANLPIVVETDSATSDNVRLPNPGQFGLSLQAVGNAPDGYSQTVPPTSRRNESFSFTAPDGVYRLHAQPGMQWYVTSATCGGLDLLTQDLPLSAGLDGTELRVRVSNNTATLSGKTMLSGYPGAAWIYLLTTGPSATPVTILRTNADGTFVRSYLPPGGYRAIALEQKVDADFQASATLNRFLDRLQSFTITPGEQHTVTLDVVPERELAP